MTRPLTCLLIATLTTACTPGRPHRDCVVLAGTDVDLMRSDIDVDRTPTACSFYQDGSGVLFSFDTPSGSTWVYLRLRSNLFEDAGDFDVVPSTIVDAFGAGAIDPMQILRQLNGQSSISAGSMMAASYVALSDGTQGWYETEGGGTGSVLTSETSDRTTHTSWPNGNVGSLAAVAIEFEAAPMTPRTSGWPGATGRATLRAQIGYSSPFERCPTPGPGGASCTETTTCMYPSDCSCPRTICDVNHRCCLDVGETCGAAGPSSQCCSGFCGPDRTCGWVRDDMPCDDTPGVDAGTSGGGMWVCTEGGSGLAAGCNCYERAPGPGEMSSCTSSYPCCAVLAVGTPSEQCACIAYTNYPSCQDWADANGLTNRVVATCPPP